MQSPHHDLKVIFQLGWAYLKWRVGCMVWEGLSSIVLVNKLLRWEAVWGDFWSIALMILHPQFKFDGNFSSYPNSNKVITIKFCSCYYQYTVLACVRIFFIWWPVHEYQISVEFEFWWKNLEWNGFLGLCSLEKLCTLQFCTCHSSTPVMACAKNCCILNTNNQITALQIFHKFESWWKNCQWFGSRIMPLQNLPDSGLVSRADSRLGPSQWETSLQCKT